MAGSTRNKRVKVVNMSYAWDDILESERNDPLYGDRIFEKKNKYILIYQFPAKDLYFVHHKIRIDFWVYSRKVLDSQAI